MRLSKREIVMLILLIVIALVFIEFRFIIRPGLDRYETLLNRQNMVTDEVNLVMINIASLESRQKTLKSNLDEIKVLSKPYFEGIKIDNLLNYSRDIILQNEITIISYTPGPAQVTQITLPQVQLHESLYKLKELAQSYKGSTGSPDQGGNPDSLTEDIELFELPISVTGTYEQLRNLLTDIERQNRTMRVNNLTIEVNEQYEMLSMSFTLEFYGLEKLVPDGTDPITKWPRAPFDGGTENPYPIKIAPPVDDVIEETAP